MFAKLPILQKKYEKSFYKNVFTKKPFGASRIKKCQA